MSLRSSSSLPEIDRVFIVVVHVHGEDRGSENPRKTTKCFSTPACVLMVGQPDKWEMQHRGQKTAKMKRGYRSEQCLPPLDPPKPDRPYNHPDPTQGPLYSASSGFGAEIARRAVASGGRVVLMDLNSNGGEKITKELNGVGGSNAVFVKGSVSEKAALSPASHAT
jgi:hypothetical protein